MEDLGARIAKKIPPQNKEAEEALLCSILLRPEILDSVYEQIKPSDFYYAQHRIIFSAMVTLASRNVNIDLVTLTNYIRDAGDLGVVGGADRLAEFNDLVPSSAYYRDYMRIVDEKSVLRRLLSLAHDVSNECYRDHEELPAYLAEVEAKLYALVEKRASISVTCISDLIFEATKKIDDIREGKAPLPGLPTGLLDLDRIIGGLQETDLTIIAARPSMGKSALVANIMQYLALNRNVPSLLFSLEMSRQQLAMRMLCGEARTDMSRVKFGYLSDGDYMRLAHAAARMRLAQIFIDDTARLDIMTLCSTARRLHREHNIGLVAVDYLQLITTNGKTENRVLEVGEISSRLKALAKELSIPVVALSQLNRSLEYRGDKRPLLADLRESGNLEQDADVIMFIYRDEVYNTNSTDEGLAEIIVGKNRNGSTGTAKCAFRKEFTRFENLMTQGGEPLWPEDE